MKRKLIEFICVVAVTLLFGISVKADSLQVNRLGGYSRYETNIKIIEQGWQKSDYAVIVSGENFPDALSAVPLAKKYDAPIVLCTGLLDNSATYELQKLGVKKVFVVGGTGILSYTIEYKLESCGIDSERIAGENRYQTSIAIANKIGTQNGVVVTTGENFPDALSIAPIAGKLQMPIILSQQGVLDSIQKKFISDNTIPKTYVLGSTDIISDNVASKFPNVERIATESDRFSRNLDIVATFGNDIDMSTVILASGADFPDALSGSAFAALNGNPIILVGEYKYPGYSESANNTLIEILLGNKVTKNIYALGLQGSISDDELYTITNATNAVETIKSKITLGSNLVFGSAGTYSYDGSNYYRVSLYHEVDNKLANNFYQYDFLVDTETEDTYKIDNITNEISPLDITNIEDTTSASILTPEQALDLVKSKVKLDNYEILKIPSDETSRKTVYNGENYYLIYREYSETGDTSDVYSLDEVCEYLVNMKTGQIIENNQGQYTIIK